MTAQTETPTFLRRPFIAGFWLIAMLPIAIVMIYPISQWFHRQDISDMVGAPLLVIIFGGTAYMWANALVRRSGWEPTWQTGLAGALGATTTMVGVHAGFGPIFETILDVLGIPPSVGDGSREEFLVIFILWTGIVTGGCGLAVGFALREVRLALKLMGLGLVCGMALFAVVALGMELLGFRVGTPRPDGIPSMPIVTLLGIWVTALVGSELFGRVLAKQRINPQ